MCRFPLLCKIIHTTHVEHFTLGYVAVLLLVAFGVWQVEPDITTFSDGLWYCFAVSTTIGFGDIVAVTAVGRILTVILVLYGIFVIALIPGVVVNYFVEFNKIRYNESLLLFMDRLEHLDCLLYTSAISAKNKKTEHFFLEKCSVFICGQVLLF